MENAENKRGIDFGNERRQLKHIGQIQKSEKKKKKKKLVQH